MFYNYTTMNGAKNMKNILVYFEIRNSFIYFRGFPWESDLVTWNPQILSRWYKATLLGVISGSQRGGNEICALLGILLNVEC